jgi:hypothetical protein
MAVTAIPTDYNGVRFRSRLEAKWASFFNRNHWRWSYEPQDFCGYIPDFALWFKRAPIFVEVKPLLWDDSEGDQAILDEARRKFAHAGIDGEVLIVGSRIVTADDGPLPHHRIGMMLDLYEDGLSPWDWAYGFKCDHCGEYSFAPEGGSWHCRVKGCYDECSGRAHLADWDVDADFRRACSEVQWRPR